MALAIGTTRSAETTGNQAASRSDWREVIWMGMRFMTPPDWEMLRHAIKRDMGRLVFMDRRRQRLQVSWATMNRPDMTQAMKDYRELDRKDDSSLTFEPVEYADWSGLYRKGLTRLARYHGDRRLTVELTLNWPAEREKAIERGVAEEFSFDVAPPPLELPKKNVGSIEWRASRWRAFGIDVTAPPGWTLTKADVKPADVVFHFDDLRQPNRHVRVRRTGMLEAWFDGSLERYIRKYVGLGPEIDYRPVQYHSRPGLQGVCIEKATRFQRLIGRAPTRRDIAWADPRAHSVMCITSWSPGDDHTVEPEAFDVEGFSVA